MEELAAEILTDKQQIIELDRKRNCNREALRALKHKKKADKSWLCFGNTFLKLSDSSAKNMIEEDQKTVNEEISSLRTQLKPKVTKLHELEGLPDFKGFNLSAMSGEDMDFVAGIK
ncbi:p53 and DNA damage-regulated protein 1 [Exaiptasia diaphana]|uniref:P53 and DNA damage-regulated protein 1 n=1 Tax=Exaiptasia diaphana TaxID=2652724 RepID=A0A913WU25_EXADI|nr:p53 and DNA damage-regulated protein 1 [Exaiptasia diaphana]KXJ17853.1 p53 and DNA damage-regulated protein 1 [Exaiptasia diaphana]